MVKQKKDQSNFVFSNFIKSKLAVFIFFMLLLLLGFFIHGDYGIGWDEPIERRNGIYSFCSAYNFFTGDSMGADFTKWNDRYYGNGLQHILLLGDYLGNCLNSSPHGNLASWHLRHFLTYVFAVVGLFFMYLTGLLIWRDRLKALFPVILYLFHPRLFAESFYNIKDIGTLSGVMLGGYFIVRYALSPNKLNAFYLGIASAFVCSIRLVGLQFVLLGILIAVFMDFVCSRRLCCKHIFLQLFILISSFFFFLILFYPACWGSNPIAFFGNAVSFMAKHPWAGTIRFCGTDYIAGTTPWYYLIVWIGITTPIPFLLLMFWGSACILKKYLPSVFKPKRRQLIMLGFVFVFWCELLILPFLVATYYNGWRHFYFLAYPMFMIAGYGIVNILSLIRKYKKCRVWIYSGTFITVLIHVAWMITQHPHQYMYFNILPRNPQNDFELDYWHVSNVNAIRKLYQKNKYIGQAKTIAYDYTIFPALTMLDDRERRYFFVVSRFGFYDCIIVINDNNCEEGKYHDPFPLQIPRKVISDEIVWVKNSLGTKKVMVYRIVEFEQNGNVDIKPVKY